LFWKVLENEFCESWKTLEFGLCKSWKVLENSFYYLYEPCVIDECCHRSGTKIFVGNIKVGTTSAELREAFEKYGKISEADVVGGFGFVVSEHVGHFVPKHLLIFSWLY